MCMKSRRKTHSDAPYRRVCEGKARVFYKLISRLRNGLVSALDALCAMLCDSIDHELDKEVGQWPSGGRLSPREQKWIKRRGLWSPWDEVLPNYRGLFALPHRVISALVSLERAKRW